MRFPLMRRTKNGLKESAMADDLDELEQRVGEKWARAAAARMAAWVSAREFEIDLREWLVEFPEPARAPIMQFPREQWASYPASRTVALTTCEALLDLDELADNQWLYVCVAMQYGGKTRIA